MINSITIEEPAAAVEEPSTTIRLIGAIRSSNGNPGNRT